MTIGTDAPGVRVVRSRGPRRSCHARCVPDGFTDLRRRPRRRVRGSLSPASPARPPEAGRRTRSPQCLLPAPSRDLDTAVGSRATRAHLMPVGFRTAVRPCPYESPHTAPEGGVRARALRRTRGSTGRDAAKSRVPPKRRRDECGRDHIARAAPHPVGTWTSSSPTPCGSASTVRTCRPCLLRAPPAAWAASRTHATHELLAQHESAREHRLDVAGDRDPIDRLVHRPVGVEEGAQILKCRHQSSPGRTAGRTASTPARRTIPARASPGAAAEVSRPSTGTGHPSTACNSATRGRARTRLDVHQRSVPCSITPRSGAASSFVDSAHAPSTPSSKSSAVPPGLRRHPSRTSRPLSESPSPA